MTGARENNQPGLTDNRPGRRHSGFRGMAALAALTAYLAVAASPARAQSFALDWWIIDCGSQTADTAGQFELSATIGQASAGTGVTAGDFVLTGGFWVVALPLPCNGFHPCDTNCDGSINLFDIDPFVAAIQTHSGCSPCAGDTNSDGTVNMFDIQNFVECLSP